MLDKALLTFSGITMLEVLAFIIPFVLAIWVDLRAHKSGHAVTMKDAAMWSCIWIACAAIFGGFVWWGRGSEAASLYVTGYVLEKALAVDNLFAFFLIFKSFGLIQPENQSLQHRILYWGILGAIVFRIVFLGAGAMIVNLSPYVLILFALIVLWTVYKMWRSGDEEEVVDYSNHWSVNMVKKFATVNPSIESRHFFSNGVTPLFLCLVCIEVCDVIFAFDSMPVIVAVVQDPYLMITSSLWAAAGLRSLYFLLIAAQNKFWALEKAVMLLLVFVSVKLIGSGLKGTPLGFHLPNAVSLSIVLVILAGGIIWSLKFPKPEEDAPETKLES
ncbi:MAG: TerC/Alx family metal homeostasis membrane protein [Verrucomicrobiota bacterium]